MANPNHASDKQVNQHVKTGGTEGGSCLTRHISGVSGCRMTGGGFGGCAVALIEPVQADRIMLAFQQRYQQVSEIDPVMFVTHAAQGGQVISSD